MGYRFTRMVGIGLRVGVAGEWSATAASDSREVTVTARRIPLAAELRIDLAVGRGAFRLSAGPGVALWLVGSNGVAHPLSTVVAEPELLVRAAYRLDLGRFVLEAGVHFDVAFLVDNLTVSGVGTVTHTPLLDLGPFLGAGVRL